MAILHANNAITSASKVIFTDGTTQTTAIAAGTTNVRVFTTSGTWTKPASTLGYSMARIQVWGGGGGGGKSTNTNSAGAGGGGGYNEITIPLSYLASSVFVTVGSGGTGAIFTGVGGDGGTSTVTFSTPWPQAGGISAIQAEGGKGGSFSAGDLYGGDGGGPLAASATININNEGRGARASANNTDGIYYGGGGGGGFGLRPAGANSVFAGAGGSVGTSSGSVAGGLSVYGGAGGTGDISVAGTGTAPAGGGGAAHNPNINGGTGGAGRVVITSF
jgi:hypothetical protein